MIEVPFGGRAMACEAPAREPRGGRFDRRGHWAYRLLVAAVFLALAIVGGGALRSGPLAPRSLEVLTVASTVDVVVAATAASTEPWTSVGEPCRALCRRLVSHATVDVGTLESDVDEQDSIWALAEELPAPVRDTSHPLAVPWERGDDAVADPSRLAGGARLARGPPVAG